MTMAWKIRRSLNSTTNTTSSDTNKKEVAKETRKKSPKVVTVRSQVNIIQGVACCEIGVSLIILLSQTIAIASSYEFSTRSLTGIWTSWFFIMAAGLTLFWSVRCTFNGLLAVLVLQIIAATMSIPLFTACCILLGVYKFTWTTLAPGQEEEAEAIAGGSISGVTPAMVGSSITILTTNLIMVLASVAEMGLNSFNAYKCYFLAYGGQPKEGNYDQTSIGSSSPEVEGGGGEMPQRRSRGHNNNGRVRILGTANRKQRTATARHNNANNKASNANDNDNEKDENNRDNNSSSSTTSGTDEDDEGNNAGEETKPSSTSPHPDDGEAAVEESSVVGHGGRLEPDLTLASTDILITKYCGVTGVILAVIIFSSQTTMLALANNNAGIKIGVGIWGALYYFVTGVVTLYNGWRPSSQSTITVFVLQLVQVILSIPTACIAYYIVATFGSCLQHNPVPDCSYKGETGFGGADLTVTIMGGVMAILGMIEGIIGIIVLLICAQGVCGIKCMISGATVYPSI